MSIQNSDNENFRASVVSNDELQVAAVFTSKQKVNEVTWSTKITQPS
ncbi:hypothetical protein [Alteromonas mediterranea]|nr:hypothetical protein [Alteromonas mediterranea]AGP97501.1 hypothetical protein I635_09895 [Alteromonas mediterranea UM7]AGQ00236.1 hypothetical protein I636_01800 [Alteromonas mediterranea UM4b]AGQ01773.1 hypothetical protein I636_09605 [Alteromonas mediterranea UM4b]